MSECEVYKETCLVGDVFLWIVFLLLIWKGFHSVTFPPSSRLHENNPEYTSQKLCMTIKSISIVALTLWGFWDVSYLFYAASLFVAAEAVDFYMSRTVLTKLYVLHHVLHILMVFAAPCRFIHTSQVLFMQETSSIFLNPYLLIRFRGYNNITLVRNIFLFTFVCCRLIVPTMFFFLTTEFYPVYNAKERAFVWAYMFGNALQWWWGVTMIMSR